MCRGNRIHITISAKNLQRSVVVRSRYLHFLKVAEAYDLDGLTVDDFYDWILESCAPELLRLPRSIHCTGASLEDFIRPWTLHYALSAAEDDSLTLLDQKTVPMEHLSFGVTLSDELCSPWTAFEPSQVQICADSPEEALSRTPREVRTNGNQTHFFKPYRYCDTSLARQELER